MLYPYERYTLRLFWVLAAGAAGMAALLALLPAAGHDQLWFLLMARRWLAGAQLYGPQAFDSNPPAIVWLSAVPVWMSRVSHLPATLWGKLLVTLLECGCALLSLMLLPHAWRKVRPYEAVALLFAAIVLFYVVPARDFGQRDHMVGFLLLPYTLAAAIDPARAPLRFHRVASGILAAVAICLKVHHALVPLVVETALLFWPNRVGAPGPDARTRIAGPGTDMASSASTRLRRLLRPEPLLILCLGFAYLLLIQVAAPLYFTKALTITRSVYWAVGHLSLPQLLWEAIELCILAALTFVLFVRQRASIPAVRLLLVAGAASFTAYLLQGTGWYYQQLPAISLFGAALALQLLDLLAARLGRDDTVRVPPWLPRAAIALVVVALALTTHFSGYPFTQDRAFAIDSPDPAIFANLPPGTPVAILTTAADPAEMAIERYHLVSAQRTNALWLLPAVLRSEDPAGGFATRSAASPAGLTAKAASSGVRLSATALGTLQHRWMAEDLARWQPQLILVERCQDKAIHCQLLEDRHDNLLAWFERDPAFVAIWQHYTLTRSDARFDVYSRR